MENGSVGATLNEEEEVNENANCFNFKIVGRVCVVILIGFRIIAASNNLENTS
jgi:hypothetical protein